MLRNSVIEMGRTRKGGRIYLQGLWLLKAGFEPEATYSVTFSGSSVTVRPATAGRKVSSKKNGAVPVIDIENSQVLEAFTNCTKLQVETHHGLITINPAHTVQLARQRRFSFTEGSLFSGGGLLSQAAASVGFCPRFAVEIDPGYAEVFEENHRDATMFNCSVEEVPYDALRQFAPLGLLTMGIPCEPYSRLRHWDRGTDAEGLQIRRNKELPPEAHPNGDMVYWAIRAIEATNPHTVLIENVPDFLKSSAFFILGNVLQRLGYTMEARVVDPTEYGGLTTRRRAVIVAKADGNVVWPSPAQDHPTFGEILDPTNGSEWFTEHTKPWLFKHWREQTEKGNGFASQQITADSAHVGTITKRYFAGQGDNPVVAHPTEPDTFRWFSLGEVKRLHGLPDDYYLGDSKTRAGEIIGQGVVVGTMAQIIAANVPEYSTAALAA